MNDGLPTSELSVKLDPLHFFLFHAKFILKLTPNTHTAKIKKSISFFRRNTKLASGTVHYRH
jgi:hypothetical protein